MLNQKKLKVALLFSGQVRDISAEKFNSGLREFTRHFDADVYLTHWDEPGVSMGHNLSKMNQAPQFSFDINNYLEVAFAGFNVVSHKSESGKQWQESLDSAYLDILNSKHYSKLTIHSLPQLYQIYQSFKLVESRLDQYDIVIRCRYDLLFVTAFHEYHFDDMTVYGLNFGRAYYPDRIYDIFFWGSPSAVRSTFLAWDAIPELIKDEFNNGLDKRDACRLLYLAAQKEGSEVTSGVVRYCDIYRPEKSLYDYYVNILYWGLIAKDAKSSLKQAVHMNFYNHLDNQMGAIKTNFLRLLTSFSIYKRGTLSYWKKKLLKVLHIV
jgi:hypothetical protein